MKPKKPKYPLVRIEWVDADVDNSWTTAEALQSAPEIEPCITVGFLARRPTKLNPSFAVAATRSHPDDAEVSFVAIQTIPKSWVKRLEYLDDLRDSAGQEKVCVPSSTRTN